MKIKQDRVVTFSYILSDAAGNQLEQADANDPTAYLHGHFNILLALEAGLEGSEIGANVSIDLPAAKAYGLRKEGLVKRIPIKNLHAVNNKRLSKGAHIQFKTDSGMVDGSIVKVGKFNADIDTNHPMAGMDLHFDIHILDVREATEQEIAHGHAHGLGGHQH